MNEELYIKECRSIEILSKHGMGSRDRVSLTMNTVCYSLCTR